MTLLECVVIGDKMSSCSRVRELGSEAVVVCESDGCSGGNGGISSMLPCLLPPLLLIDGCLLLLAVDGREESFVPCLILDRGAPTEAERLASRSKDLEERPASGVFDLSLILFFLLLLPPPFLLLGLFVGNGGNAQS